MNMTTFEGDHQLRRRAVSVGGIRLSPVTMQQSVAMAANATEVYPSKPFIVAAINAHFVVTAQKDPRLHEYLNRADLCVADGSSLCFSALVFGAPLPERITGIDLMVRLCERAAKQQKSVYFLGGKAGAAAGAAAALGKMFPALRIAGVDRPKFGCEFDRDECAQICQRIRAAAPDFLFLCFGVPLQEYWIEQFALDLPVRVVMGNGAAFDVLAGFFSRPPLWVQSIGMEWFVRLIAEPRRLWRRYLFGNMRFLLIVLKQALQTYVYAPHKASRLGAK